MILLKNPLTIYIKYLFNWFANKIKYRNFYQGYLTFIYNTKIGRRVKIYDNVVISDSEIGDFSYISAETKIFRTKIGKFCSIGPNCLIGWGLHPTENFISTHPAFYSLGGQAGITFVEKNYFDEQKSINIGNDVWIGANVTIIDGVNIGDCAIIAAGAVVNKDVPSYAVFGGVPAKFIKYRFDEDIMKTLERVKWWDKDINWLKQNASIFRDATAFKQHFDVNMNV